MKGSIPSIMSSGSSSCNALLAGLTRLSLIQGNLATSMPRNRSGKKPIMKETATSPLVPMLSSRWECQTAAATQIAIEICRKDWKNEIGDRSKLAMRLIKYCMVQI